MRLYRSLKLELAKLRHRYFFITWFFLMIVPVAYELYNIRNLGFSDRFLFKSTTDYYFYVESANVELLSLTLPIMASLLISKLMDLEHKDNTWKLLLTSNQSFIQLWFVKFFIVYLLMEVSVFVSYSTTALFIFSKLKVPIPFFPLIMTFLGMSGANIITLTIAQILAVIYKNQLVVNIEGLVGGFVGIISALLPRIVSYFIPWGYYTLNILSGNKPVGTDSEGLVIWEIYNISPNYLVIFLVSLIFLIINILTAIRLSKREI